MPAPPDTDGSPPDRRREPIADARRDGQTIIGHAFLPREAPLEHQCRECGWPKENHE